MLLRSRFLWKLFFGFAAVVLVAAVAVFLLVVPRVERDARLEVEARLLDQARLVRAVLGSRLDDEAALRGRIDALSGVTGTRLTVIDSHGRVIADSDADPRRLDNHGNRPEVLAAKAGGLGVAVRHSDSLGRALMYVALPLEPGAAGASGFVRTARSLEDVEQRLAQLRRKILVASLMGIAVGWVLAFFVARAVAAPVLDLASAAESIAQGDYRRRVEVTTRDELGRLAETVNTTSAQLAAQLETIAHDRERLTAVLAAMVEGVVAVDHEERVVHCNEAASRLLGLSSGAYTGRPLYEMSRVPEIGEAISRALAEGEPVRRSVTLGQRSKERHLELLASPLRNGGAKPSGAVLVLHDITQLQRLEGIRRQFVSNVSHELKTPLTAIKGMVETLLDAKEMDASTRRHFLERISSQTSRLVALVADLLSLSRIEAGEAAVERRPIDLRTPVLESVRALRAMAERCGVELATELPSRPVVVLGEDEALRQAISNLVDNAIKYSPDGARVEVRLFTDDGKDGVVEVEDHGVGISQEHLERIFERFYRVDPARSRELGGTGLGLAIVKNVAHALAGEVDVRSRLGEGSVFVVRLPLVPAEGGGTDAGFTKS